MTRETILAMTGRELDAAVAEQVMGQSLNWHHEQLFSVLNGDDGYLPEARFCNDGRGIYMRCGGCDLSGYGNEVDWEQFCPTPECPAYSTDANASRLMEAEIERRGLQAKYVRLLWPLVNGPECPPNFFASEVFGLMTAPLDQKCRAALLAVLETEEKINAE